MSRYRPSCDPYQVIHALDGDAAAVAARIARAVGKPPAPGLAERSTGQSLIFTVASLDGSQQLAVTPADGVPRMVTPPWRQGNAFGIALRDFEKMTREPAVSDAEHAHLVGAAQTVGAGLFGLLVCDDALRATFERATAAGPRAVLTLRSDDDVLLSLPWELLFHAGRFLVRDGLLDVVRSTPTQVQFETQLTPPQEPFTLVTNVSAPEGSALGYEEESFRITRALTGHCAETPTELGTLADLIATVRRARPPTSATSAAPTPPSARPAAARSRTDQRDPRGPRGSTRHVQGSGRAAPTHARGPDARRLRGRVKLRSGEAMA